VVTQAGHDAGKSNGILIGPECRVERFPLDFGDQGRHIQVKRAGRRAEGGFLPQASADGLFS
jgi:hypothetical protein